MTKRISLSVLVACAAVLVASLIIIMGVLYDYFGRIEHTQLADELEIAAAAVEEVSGDIIAVAVQESEPRAGVPLDAVAGSGDRGDTRSA